MDDVAHQHTPFDGGKKVFVVPNGVGAYTLLVDKVLAFANVRDLGDPAHRNSEEWRYGVLNEQPRIHALGHVSVHDESKARGRNLGEVARR